MGWASENSSYHQLHPGGAKKSKGGTSAECVGLALLTTDAPTSSLWHATQGCAGMRNYDAVRQRLARGKRACLTDLSARSAKAAGWQQTQQALQFLAPIPCQVARSAHKHASTCNSDARNTRGTHAVSGRGRVCVRGAERASQPTAVCTVVCTKCMCMQHLWRTCRVWQRQGECEGGQGGHRS